MDVATGKVPFHQSDCISHYKEVKKNLSTVSVYIHHVSFRLRHLMYYLNAPGLPPFSLSANEKLKYYATGWFLARSLNHPWYNNY